MRVYQLNECDWWAGNSLAEVKQEYLEMTGMDPDEAFCEPHVLTESDMQKLIFTDEAGDKRTYAEELRLRVEEGLTGPFPFASTEW